MSAQYGFVPNQFGSGYAGPPVSLPPTAARPPRGFDHVRPVLGKSRLGAYNLVPGISSAPRGRYQEVTGRPVLKDGGPAGSRAINDMRMQPELGSQSTPGKESGTSPEAESDQPKSDPPTLPSPMGLPRKTSANLPGRRPTNAHPAAPPVVLPASQRAHALLLPTAHDPDGDDSELHNGSRAAGTSGVGANPLKRTRSQMASTSSDLLNASSNGKLPEGARQNVHARVESDIIDLTSPDHSADPHHLTALPYGGTHRAVPGAITGNSLGVGASLSRPLPSNITQMPDSRTFPSRGLVTPDVTEHALRSHLPSFEGSVRPFGLSVQSHSVSTTTHPAQSLQRTRSLTRRTSGLSAVQGTDSQLLLPMDEQSAAAPETVVPSQSVLDTIITGSSKAHDNPYQARGLVSDESTGYIGTSVFPSPAKHGPALSATHSPAPGSPASALFSQQTPDKTVTASQISISQISVLGISSISCLGRYREVLLRKTVRAEKDGKIIEGTVHSIDNKGSFKILVDGTVLSASDFVAKVGHTKGTLAKMAEFIILVEFGATLASIRDDPALGLANPGNVQEGVENNLRRFLHHIKPTSPISPKETVKEEVLILLTKMQDEKFTSSSFIDDPNVVYRVCRESEFERIHASEPLICRADTANLPACNYVDFFYTMWNHVRNGSRTVTSKFISCTRSLESALWWSRGGVQPIVKINLTKIPIWFDIAFEDGAWLGHKDQLTTNFGRSSAEVVVFGSVPTDAYELVPVTFGTPHAFYHFTSKHMPSAKSPFPPSIGTILEKRGSVTHIYEDASTKPLRVEHGKQTFILKMGGSVRLASLRYTFNTTQVIREYIALRLYDLMGVAVPSAALYQYRVKVDGNFFPVWLLVTAFIDSTMQVQDADVNHKKAVARGVVADIALGNTDALGDKYCNIVMRANPTTGELTAFRVDAGAAFGMRPQGDTDGTDLTRMVEEAEINVGRLFNSLTKAATGTGVAQEAAGLKLLKDFWGQALKNKRALGDRVLELLGIPKKPGREAYMVACRKQIDSLLPDFIMCARFVEKRLWALYNIVQHHSTAGPHSLGTEAAGAVDGSSTEAFSKPPAVTAGMPTSTADDIDATPPPLPKRARKGGQQNRMHGTIDVVGRAAKPAKDHHVMDVDTTARSEGRWKCLSPFFPHAPGFDIPGMPGLKAASVEGLWQGLKILEGGTSEPDQRRLFNKSMTNLKVDRKKKVLGHWVGADQSLLSYVDARVKIYIPTYRYKLERYVAEEIEELIAFVKHQPSNKLILRDYYLNGNVHDTSKPLSHASLLKAYIEERLATEEPSAT